jgi:hypothetical protein
MSIRRSLLCQSIAIAGLAFGLVEHALATPAYTFDNTTGSGSAESFTLDFFDKRALG